MRDLCRQLVRFSITGVVNTFIDFGLFNIWFFSPAHAVVGRSV